jgi:hypothetical protein
VKPSLVWLTLKTHDMPQLYCFHEEKACTHPMGGGLFYVAECARKKAGKCGYYGKKASVQVMKHANACLTSQF